MKVLSLFSGIGAFEKALKNIGQQVELVGFSEIDKYAVKSYCAIHGVSESMNLGDITKINEKALPKDIDLITYGFPCQDISLSGKQKGLLLCEECNTSNAIPENYIKRLRAGEKFFCEKCGAELKQTRSGLFFEALRIIEETRPKIAIAENVKNLVGKKFKNQFQVILDSLEEAGYNNYWKVLNAKDYGIPQNRERVFIVSIRKEVDNGLFRFPESFPLKLRLKDLLESEVDEKFYLSQKAIDGFNRHKERHAKKGHSFGWQPTDGNECDFTLKTTGGTRPSDNFIEVFDLYNGNQIDSNVIGTITTGCAHNGSGTFLVREATKKGYAEAVEGDSINLEQPNSKTRRGRVGHGVAQTLTTSPKQGAVVSTPVEPVNAMPDGTCRTIKSQYCKTSNANLNRISTFGATGASNGLRIRKLTPKECFRLMGFSDEDFAKAEAVNSNTQLYKQAGNSIVVDVIVHIFTEMTADLTGKILIDGIFTPVYQCDQKDNCNNSPYCGKKCKLTINPEHKKID